MGCSLRPAFGSGEDWNGGAKHNAPFPSMLRPAFGSGEDWNPECGEPVGMDLGVAPGLRVGRGLELAGVQFSPTVASVAPGLRVGRGLELGALGGESVCPRVAPGLGYSDNADW